jgi:hypothetical protein
MSIEEFIRRLAPYRVGGAEAWIMNNMAPLINFKNEYIKILRFDSSNKAGAYGNNNGKQWGIIIELKRDFSNLPNWIRLKAVLGNGIAVTRVTRGINRGNYGIRLYRMSRNMNTEIIENLLEVIFE